MNKKNTDSLNEIGGSLVYPSIPYGYDVGDGWFLILGDMLIALKKLKLSNPPKYAHLHLTQVKEKFGLLRVHFYPYFPEVQEIVDVAETRSASTCENCGSKIVEYTISNGDDGWFEVPRCDDCS